MKYIRFKHLGFVVFEETQSHSEIAKLLGDEPESAGFVHATDWCNDGKLTTSGHSTTLGKHSTPQDEAMMQRRFQRI